MKKYAIFAAAFTFANSNNCSGSDGSNDHKNTDEIREIKNSNIEQNLEELKFNSDIELELKEKNIDFNNILYSFATKIGIKSQKIKSLSNAIVALVNQKRISIDYLSDIEAKAQYFDQLQGLELNNADNNIFVAIYLEYLANCDARSTIIPFSKFYTYLLSLRYFEFDKDKYPITYKDKRRLKNESPNFVSFLSNSNKVMIVPKWRKKMDDADTNKHFINFFRKQNINLIQEFFSIFNHKLENNLMDKKSYIIANANGNALIHHLHAKISSKDDSSFECDGKFNHIPNYESESFKSYVTNQGVVIVYKDGGITESVIKKLASDLDLVEELQNHFTTITELNSKTNATMSIPIESDMFMIKIKIDERGVIR